MSSGCNVTTITIISLVFLHVYFLIFISCDIFDHFLTVCNYILCEYSVLNVLMHRSLSALTEQPLDTNCARGQRRMDVEHPINLVHVEHIREQMWKYPKLSSPP